MRDLRGQAREQVPLARGGIAGFEGVEVIAVIEVTLCLEYEALPSAFRLRTGRKPD